MAYITYEIELPKYLEKLGTKIWIGKATDSQIELMRHKLIHYSSFGNGTTSQFELSFTLPNNVPYEEKYLTSCKKVATRENKKRKPKQ